MGFPTKVQLIRRKESEQWYITFPRLLLRRWNSSAVRSSSGSSKTKLSWCSDVANRRRQAQKNSGPRAHEPMARAV